MTWLFRKILWLACGIVFLPLLFLWVMLVIIIGLFIDDRPAYDKWR
jgi:hypothetical protein